LLAISRTICRRSGEAKAEVLALTEQIGELLGALGHGDEGGWWRSCGAGNVAAARRLSLGRLRGSSAIGTSHGARDSAAVRPTPVGAQRH
jgi:hypothetical protein